MMMGIHPHNLRFGGGGCQNIARCDIEPMSDVYHTQSEMVGCCTFNLQLNQ